jgi:hypothetical protein
LRIAPRQMLRKFSMTISIRGNFEPGSECKMVLTPDSIALWVRDFEETPWLL